MTFNTCKSLIISDLARLTKISLIEAIKYLLLNASFRITFWFRIGSFLKTKKGLLCKLLYGLAFLIHKHNKYLTGIQLDFGTQIGKGLCFAHFSCIIIHQASKIGDNCTIYQGVTIGGVRGPRGGVPSIGNNVVLSSGSQVIGCVKIGDNVVIGAGAIVVKNIPDNSVAVGIPAEIISQKGKELSAYYINN